MSLNKWSCRAMIDSTLFHSAEAGATPRPPSPCVDVMYECISLNRSAGDSGTASKSSAVIECVVGRPHKKSECLHAVSRLYEPQSRADAPFALREPLQQRLRARDHDKQLPIALSALPDGEQAAPLEGLQEARVLLGRLPRVLARERLGLDLARRRAEDDDEVDVRRGHGCRGRGRKLGGVEVAGVVRVVTEMLQARMRSSLNELEARGGRPRAMTSQERRMLIAPQRFVGLDERVYDRVE